MQNWTTYSAHYNSTFKQLNGAESNNLQCKILTTTKHTTKNEKIMKQKEKNLRIMSHFEWENYKAEVKEPAHES